MATSAFNPAYRPVTVREFLAMDLGDGKAELVDGLIQMMAGGSARHAAIAANLISALMTRLRGTGCRPYGSDLAVRTGEASIRFPDVTVYCRDDLANDTGNEKLLGVPRVAFEVLVGGAEKATKVLGELQELGAATPLEFPELADLGFRVVGLAVGVMSLVSMARKLRRK